MEGRWVCSHHLTVTRVLGPAGPWRTLTTPPAGHPVRIIALPDQTTYLATEEESAPGR